MADDLIETERAKYAAMWARPEYRERSPGMRMAAQAWAALGCRPGQSLCDYGAGTGRAAQWFSDRGLVVTAVDLYPEAVTEFSGPVVEGCLWLLPEMVAFDYGFCADVMEHLPPKRTLAAFQGIAARTRYAAFFQIALFECHMGELIGEHLHLCVRPAAWWLASMRRAFRRVEALRSGPKYCIAIGRP